MMAPRHIVAVAGLVSDAQGRVLMIRSPRRDWEYPGGQVEEGENLISALVREVWEETGVTVSVGELVGVYSNVQSHIVMFDFLCTALSGTPTTSAESLAVEWVERAEALERIVRPPIRYRMTKMLDFKGDVTYGAYSFAANEITVEYTNHIDRTI